MAGQISAAVSEAITLVRNHTSIAEASRRVGCSRRAVELAMSRLGIAGIRSKARSAAPLSPELQAVLALAVAAVRAGSTVGGAVDQFRPLGLTRYQLTRALAAAAD